MWHTRTRQRRRIHTWVQQLNKELLVAPTAYGVNTVDENGLSALSASTSGRRRTGCQPISHYSIHITTNNIRHPMNATAKVAVNIVPQRASTNNNSIEQPTPQKSTTAAVIHSVSPH
ncbi:unnamed protein product, partial [Ceratitis capitata]